MKIKYAPNDVQSMSQDGKAILKSLLNNNLTPIDLVVRESIQNSLDATIDSEKVTLVNFKIGKFSSAILAPHFEEIETILVKSYPKEQDFIAISDKNTVGLTGDYKSDNIESLDKSNFHKLVFGIGKNQEKDGAGGSWGLGKTSYFRMGIGIVLYYTRVKENGCYEERLIASLIEDPTKKERILPGNERGIAWWGEYDQYNRKIYPLTDTQQISEILSIFEIENYQDDETGTTIIIPYLKDLNEGLVGQGVKKYPWEYSRETAIEVAIQRWYFPRMWNEKYADVLGNSMLDCRINGKGLHPNINMEPIFKIYQDIYTSALLGKAIESSINIKPITLGNNALLNKSLPIGHIAFKEVSKEELKMTSPDNKISGLAYLGLKDNVKVDQHKSQVIAYGRKPGMIVKYSIDGLWANSEIELKEGNILLGYFVPNSNAELTNTLNELGYRTVESYLRAIENSDHAEWEDQPNISIVTRIIARCNKTIKDSYQSPEELELSTATSSLSRKFGAILMPPKNFGKTSTHKRQGKSNEGNRTKSKGVHISVQKSIPRNENTVEVMFNAFIKKASHNEVTVQVLTQSQKLDQKNWIKVMGEAIPYPFEIKEVIINKIDAETYEKSYANLDIEEFEFKIDKDDLSSFSIISYLNNSSEIEGKLILQVNSNQFIPNLAIRAIN